MKSGVWHLGDILASIPTGSGDEPYVEPLRHGTMRLGFYAPKGKDPQTPHEQDELYFVQSGSGVFVHGEERTSCEPGDAVFVAAGEPHRFEGFSGDFRLWVVFWDPPGGDCPG